MELKLSSLTLSYLEGGPKWWIESGDWEGRGERGEGRGERGEGRGERGEGRGERGEGRGKRGEGRGRKERSSRQ